MPGSGKDILFNRIFSLRESKQLKTIIFQVFFWWSRLVAVVVAHSFELFLSVNNLSLVNFCNKSDFKLLTHICYTKGLHLIYTPSSRSPANMWPFLGSNRRGPQCKLRSASSSLTGKIDMVEAYS